MAEKNIRKHLTEAKRYGIIYTMKSSVSKYILAFISGALIAIYIFPPQPCVEMDSVSEQIIIQEVLERIEENGYDITLAKRDVKRSWWN